MIPGPARYKTFEYAFFHASGLHRCWNPKGLEMMTALPFMYDIMDKNNVYYN